MAIEAAAAARGAERARSAAKGLDFEDLLADMLGEIARGSGDLLDRTTLEAGSVMRSKKGDFVLTIDHRRGARLRPPRRHRGQGPPHVGAGDARGTPGGPREPRCRRGGRRLHAGPRAEGVAPFTVIGGDVYCVIDPESPEAATLEAAIRLARLLALASLAERDVTVDAAAIGAALIAIREQLELVRQMKSQLTSIANATGTVTLGLDEMRSGILARVAEAEAEIRTTARLKRPRCGVVRTRCLALTRTTGRYAWVGRCGNM